MNKSFYSAMALLAMLAAPAVHAADEKFYVGAGLSSGGSLTISDGAAKFDNTNNPMALSLYGGYNFTDNIAIETGYTHFGKFKFAAPVILDLNAFHVAAVGRVALGESCSVLGKLGVARNSMKASVPGASDTSSTTRPLFGIGADYRLAKNLSLALELTDYGTTKDNGLHITRRKLEAGVKFHF